MLHLSLLVLLSCATQQTSTEQVLESASNHPGVCVHIGCGDGSLTAKLAANGNLVVHGLEQDERRVATARQRLRDRGLYGQATVDPWAGPRLPHLDGMVNVLVAERPGRVPNREILRVLVPGGTAWIRKAGTWRKIVKPKSSATDEWTHGTPRGSW